MTVVHSCGSSTKHIRVRLNNNCDNIDKLSIKDKFPDAYDFISTLMEMGVANVTIYRRGKSTEDSDFVVYGVNTRPGLMTGININMSTDDLQRLTDDAEHRELWLSTIQHRIDTIPILHGDNNVVSLIHLGICPVACKNAWLEALNGGEEEPKDDEDHPSVSLKDICQHESLTEKFARRFAERGKLLAIENEMYMLEKAANAYDENFSYTLLAHIRLSLFFCSFDSVDLQRLFSLG